MELLRSTKLHPVRNTQVPKLQKVMMVLAVIISLILCIELAIRGYSFYHQAIILGIRPADEFPNHFFRFRVGLEYALLNIIFLTYLIVNKQRIEFSNFKKVFQCTSVFLIIAFISYPITGDVFQYLHYGLMGLSQVNPFVTDAGDFSSPLLPLLSWKQSSTYGPVSQIVFTIAAAFTSLHSILALYVFKLFCLTFHLINAFLIWRQLKDNSWQSLITFAYLINPYLLFEQVVNAHLDVFVATVLLLIIISLRHRRYLVSIALTWVGFLTKTLPIIWLPLLLLFLFKVRGWKFLFTALLFSALLILILSQTVLPTYSAWESLLNPGVGGKASGSIHNLLLKLAKLQSLPISPALKEYFSNKFGFIAYASFSLFYLYKMTRLYFKERYAETDLILDIGWVTLALLLFATAWYRPWYASILLAIAALNPQSSIFVFVSVFYCLFSSHYYYLFGPDTIYSVVTVLPPIAVLLSRQRLLIPRLATSRN